MTTKHTPGPWSVETGRYYVTVRAPSRVVADLRTIGGKADGENRANARLIAAAPDLYDFAASCESVGEEQLAAMDLGLALDTIRTVRALASAALAKARGEG